MREGGSGMFPFRSIHNRSGKQVSADLDRLAALAQQPYRSVRRYRMCILIVLTLIGLYLLAAGSTGTPLASQGEASGSASLSPISASSLGPQAHPFPGSGPAARSGTTTP